MGTTNTLDLNNRVSALEKAAIDGLTASDVAYDNTDSGLTAANVQEAVDGLRHADNIMMSDGVTSVEDDIGNLLNSAVFEPFQAPGTSPFAEGGSGYILKVKYNNTILGYFIIRPKGFSGTGNRKVALELYDANWSQAWEVHRDYPA